MPQDRKKIVLVQHKTNFEELSPVSTLFWGCLQTEIQAADGGICKLCLHLWILRKVTTVGTCRLQWALLTFWAWLLPCLQLHIQRFRSRQHSPATDEHKEKKCQKLLDIRCQLPSINAKGDLLNPFSETPLRSHRVLPMDNIDAVLFRRGPLLYKDKLLLKILMLTD